MGAMPVLPSTTGLVPANVTQAIEMLQQQIANIPAPIASTPFNLQAALPAIQQALQANGPFPLNLTGLTGSSGGVSSVLIGVSSARRVASPLPLGQLYYETDRRALYVATAAGWLWMTNAPFAGNRNSLMATLGVNDAGFIYTLPTFDRLFRWDGGQFTDAPGSPARFQIVFFDTAIPPTGWTLANGVAANISHSDASVTAGGYTPPDMIGGGEILVAGAVPSNGTNINGQAGISFSITRRVGVPMVRL